MTHENFIFMYPRKASSLSTFVTQYEVQLTLSAYKPNYVLNCLCKIHVLTTYLKPRWLLPRMLEVQ